MDYEIITQTVDRYDLTSSASHLHGLITANICLQNKISNQDLLLRILEIDKMEQSDHSEILSQLNMIFTHTEQSLVDQMFSFSPMLPDSDSDLIYRIDSLAQWCEGFVLFFNFFTDQVNGLSDDAKEVLEDFSQIQLSTPGSDDEEEIEAALSEIEEYIRIGSQFIFDELHHNVTTH